MCLWLGGGGSCVCDMRWKKCIVTYFTDGGSRVCVKEASNTKHEAKLQPLTNGLNYWFPLLVNNRETLSDRVQVMATGQSARSKRRHVGPPSLILRPAGIRCRESPPDTCRSRRPDIDHHGRQKQSGNTKPSSYPLPYSSNSGWKDITPPSIPAFISLHKTENVKLIRHQHLFLHNVHF